jgi:hypothetical protein
VVLAVASDEGGARGGGSLGCPLSPRVTEIAPVLTSSRHPLPHTTTGAFSVVLAVGYLLLVQVMDSREMLPPPPEAMGMGEVR